MEIFFSHQTACNYWRSPYAERRDGNAPLKRLPSAPIPCRTLDPEMLVRFGLGEPPYHMAVADANQRSHDPAVVSHVMGGTIPRDSFQPLRGELRVATPELTFCQMAGSLGFAGAVKLGYELCSRFVLSELLQDPDSRDPVTTVSAINNYIRRSGDRPGIRAARQAVRYVRNNTESPMEIAVSMLLTLPRMYGGYGLPVAEPNMEITVKNRGGGQARTYRGDLVWPRQRVIVEYDSDLHHSRKAELTSDALRRNDLQDAGWRVIVMTKAQVFDETAMDQAAAQLARALGVKDNGTAPRAMLVRRLALRELVLFS